MYSVLLALVFSALFYFVGIYTYVEAKRDQLQESLDHLYRNLFEEEIWQYTQYPIYMGIMIYSEKDWRRSAFPTRMSCTSSGM